MASRLPDHRVGMALNAQHWQSLTFLHWPVDPSTIAHRVPPPLEVDTFGGTAWIGVTPFRMSYLGTPGPRIRLVPRFVEVNVRTYVRAPDGHDGVWFFSLECSSPTVIASLRTLGLPYVRADTRLTVADPRTYRYVSRRSDGTGRFGAEVRRREALAAADPLVTFLTGRWNAFSRAWGRVWRIPIEHEPWPLHRGDATVHAGALLDSHRLPVPHVDPLVHVAPMVHVRVGVPRGV